MTYLIEKPIQRNPFRRRLGKLFYSTKRRLEWWLDANQYASSIQSDPFPFLVKAHQSILLRPLRDVDMKFQYNKVVNLRLAIRHLHGLIIKPGEVFSFWYLVGSPTEQKGYLPGLVLNQG